ncbi:MAG: protein translocase subunit SecD [Alistipes sp.]|nr:protein translocase subunit SecD [Alistipes sp.]
MAILLGIASVLQLSFTFVARSVEKDAVEYAKKAAAAKVADERAKLVDEAELKFPVDSTATEAERAQAQANIDAYVAKRFTADDEQKLYNAAYAESERHYLNELMWDKEVYNLGIAKYTYGDCKNRELNLGLDLRGGMNVMLEVKPTDVIYSDIEKCDDYRKNPDFHKRMDDAINNAKDVEDVDASINTFLGQCDDEDLEIIFGTTNRGAIRKSVADRVDNSTDNVLASIKHRIDALGVVQPTIQRVVGTNRISIELPGIKEPERVKKLLSSSALLEFWAVGNSTDAQKVYSVIASNSELASKVNYIGSDWYVGTVKKADMDYVFDALSDLKSQLPMDVKLVWSNKSVDGKNYGDYYLCVLKGTAPLMDGSGIIDATAQTSEVGGACTVSMTMNGPSTKKWATITGNNIGKFIAIVMDDVMYSAPRVNARIDGSSLIEGSFTVQEAEDLANVLKAGKSPVRTSVVYSEVVGPSLGEKAVSSGLISIVIAFILVLIYMAFFYKAAGWMANCALIFNVLLLMGVLVSFGAVLTLPGIAGIVLTMGMAVDANVIIFERIKEELRAGKGLALAIKDGFSNAYSAIIDGNLTTIITGIVLFYMGTGPVKGFATTLIVGILTSLFCSIFITRLLIEKWIERRGGISFSRKITENFMQNVKISFIKLRKYSYIISGTLIVASVISLFTLGLNKGVEFTGGRTYVVKFDKSINVEAIRGNVSTAFEAIADASNASVEVKQFGDANQIRIVTQFEPSNEYVDTFKSEWAAVYGTNLSEAALAEKLAQIDEDYVVAYTIWEAVGEFYTEPLDFDEEFSDNNDSIGITQSSKVDASISNEMTKKSIAAVLIALVAIGLYIVIRFRRWQWATGATLALAHNAVLVIGIFSMLYAVMPFNLEINQAFIAAILTIIGYTINDTVVIFDRIREFIHLYPKRDLKTNIDNAICATLSRTINTSGTTLVTLLSIFILGGESIRGFVFALIIGIVIGTYSSVFVATPIAYDLQRKKAAKAKAAAEENKAE